MPICFDPETGQSTGGTKKGWNKIMFSYDDSFPMILGNLLADECIEEIKIVYEVPFDDASAEASIGTAADNQLMLSIEENCPQLEAGYGNSKPHKFVLDETLRLYLSPGTSTQGSGYVLFNKI